MQDENERLRVENEKLLEYNKKLRSRLLPGVDIEKLEREALDKESGG
jgi:hypothetical protein